MKANEVDRDELAAFLETDEGRAFLDGIDATCPKCDEECCYMCKAVRA